MSAVRCTKCHQALQVPEGFTWGSVRCPCGQVVVVGGLPAAVAAQPPQPAPRWPARHEAEEQPGSWAAVHFMACGACLACGLLIGGVGGWAIGFAGRGESIGPAPAGQFGKAEDVKPAPVAPAAPAVPPQAPAKMVNQPPPIPRDEFRALVMNETPDGVIQAVGRPLSTSGGQGGFQIESWTYRERTVDPITGRTDRVATVSFQGGRVIAVYFL